MARTKRPLDERLFGSVDKSGDCWLWTGSVSTSGYGLIGRGGRGGKNAYVHRASWEIANGPIPPGMLICHKCDVKLCVNPAHMFLGSHTDNKHDSINKGRSDTRGEGNAMSKLTAADVARIRERREDPAVLAAELGVSRSHIYRLRGTSRWKHL